jgi:predicted ATPase
MGASGEDATAAAEAAGEPFAPRTDDEALTFNRMSISVTGGRYKSIQSPLEWQDVPPLAILAGLNGSGKTQLLEALAVQFDTQKRPQFGNTDIRIEVTGDHFSNADVLLLTDFSKIRDASSGWR